MADNNNNAFTVTITPQTFNGIITGNGDGTYNVTYTSLTEDQIHDIGQQFAKHLSDTDENGNSKAGLHKIALTGDYMQLENKPSASKLQGFHEVAFSGQASALDNGEGNNVTFLTKAAFDASVAGKIKQLDVNNWNNKVDIDEISGINNDIIQLKNNKLQFVYFNTASSPYSYDNFGLISFYTDSDQLIDDICIALQNNKIVILLSPNGSWIVTNYTINEELNTKIISIHFISNDTYYNVLEEASETIIREQNESNEDYKTRFNIYIMDHLTHKDCLGLLVKDDNQNTSYFYFTMLDTQKTLIDLNNRITALEEASN